MARRIFWLSVVLVLGLWSSLEAANLRQHDITAGGVTEPSRALAFPSPTAGNTLLVAVCAVFEGTFSTAAPTLSDTQGNTWSVAINVGANDAASYRGRLYLAYTISTTAANNTVTCDPVGAGDFITLVILEFDGIVLSATLDRTITNSATSGASVTSGTTLATTVANEVLVAAAIYDGQTTITETSPFLLVDEEENWDSFMPVSVTYQIVSSTGTYSAAWTLGSSSFKWAAGLATFKATVPAASPRRGHAIVFP